MGPATLLCPSSSGVQLWSQASPVMKASRHLKEGGSFPASPGYSKYYANVISCTGDPMIFGRPTLFSHPACLSDKCNKPILPFAWRGVLAAAMGGEVSVEESPVASGTEALTELSGAVEMSTTSTERVSAATEAKGQGGPRGLNRSNISASRVVTVSSSQLVTGAVFSGKVASIQSFGAFVDFGAFTNGLIHISKLSRSYVKNVEDVVQVGQDVNVQILDVDKQASCVSLMLIEEEGEEEGGGEEEAVDSDRRPARQQQGRMPGPRRSAPGKRSAMRGADQLVTKLKKDEVVTGTVKNMIKSGVFLSLPDGTDGYLPVGEVVFKPPNTSLESQFQVGQEVMVRVLRVDKGRISLTTRQEVNLDKINEALNRDVVGGATNPFEIAFRKNALIASFLSEKEKQKEAEAEFTDQDKGEQVASAEDKVSGEPAEEAVMAASAEEVKEKEGEAVDDTNTRLTSATTDEETVVGPAPAEEAASMAAEVSAKWQETAQEVVAPPVEEKVTSDVEDQSPPAVEGTIASDPLVEEKSNRVLEGVKGASEAAVEQDSAVLEEVGSLRT